MAEITVVNMAEMYVTTSTIDLIQRAKALSGVYENVALTRLNDHVVRMSHMEKAYPWHFHPNSDEMFLGVEGVHAALSLSQIVVDNRPYRNQSPLTVTSVPRRTRR